MPPTIRAQPTSEITRPKPASNAAVKPKRASLKPSHAVRQPLNPNVRAVSRNSGLFFCKAAVANTVKIGKAIIACPIAIAVGVKSKPHAPSGPWRESSIYKIKPTTTVGNDSKPCKITIIIRRPANSPNARQCAAASAGIAAAVKPIPLTASEVKTISHKSGSPENNRRNASTVAAGMSMFVLLLLRRKIGRKKQRLAEEAKIGDKFLGGGRLQPVGKLLRQRGFCMRMTRRMNDNNAVWIAHCGRRRRQRPASNPTAKRQKGAAVGERVGV